MGQGFVRGHQLFLPGAIGDRSFKLIEGNGLLYAKRAARQTPELTSWASTSRMPSDVGSQWANVGALGAPGFQGDLRPVPLDQLQGADTYLPFGKIHLDTVSAQLVQTAGPGPLPPNTGAPPGDRCHGTFPKRSADLPQNRLNSRWLLWGRSFGHANITYDRTQHLMFG